MEATNGAQGTPVAMQVSAARRTREQVADSVRTLLADEERNYQRLRQEADLARQRAEHLRKALEHLTTEPTAAAKPGPKPKAAVTKQPGRLPNEERLKLVLDAYRQQSEPITPSALAKFIGPGISTDTVVRATDLLRERELVRFTGKYKGGSQYAVMPEARVVDEEEAARAA